MSENDEGVVLPPAKDSLASAADAAVTRLDSEGEDTQTEPSHKPESPPQEAETDIEKLLAELEANKDKIPGERLQFLNPNMESGFHRKMNWLQKSADTVQRALDQSGITLPPGKSAMDLLTEDDGKGFFDALAKVQAQNLAPVKDFISQQETAQRINAMAAAARQAYPLVAQHAQEVAQIFDSNPDYVALAQQDNWAALPLVLQGIATAVDRDKMAAENKSLKKLLEANKIAIKTGGSTSRAGGAPLQDASTTAKTIEKAYEIAQRKLAQAG